MFRTLARLLADSGFNTDEFFKIHPLQLSRWLEEAWADGGQADWPGFDTSPTGVTPQVVSRFQLPGEVNGGLLQALRSGINTPGEFSVSPPPSAVGIGTGLALPWDHLIYAFLVESTGVAEILREVVRRFVVGESLEAVKDTTYSWVRSTEELFFRDPPLFSITGTTSALRPDPLVNRRNAYWRMFGMDLPHAPPGIQGQPWKTDVGASANLRFGEVWIELLRQVWLAFVNDSNSVGANPTDASYIGYLCQTLSEMMGMRRRAGMLAREEFGHVVTMSWFHLLLETENEVVADLQAGAGTAGNAADRLARIAQRVGITPPRRARELFELADLVSLVLMFIEAGRFNEPKDAELLFRSGSPDPLVRNTMNRVIDLWQSATGESIKEQGVRVANGPIPSSPQPVRLPSAHLPTAPDGAKSSSNGAAPVQL
ncbi:hypothetical protein G5C60_12485 [Streptomyces sp. HC44]|uniref:Uncharacterized protein n=1 Tax=Streptomyces scabichelini TaxID=2711217 RepID=A0A6G4V3A8_9ACTN|nr:hypothetical protein [Streptomyces scabichelini]NGO08415.1 hypothetical protein [Streptomyces scabichelini]